MAATGAMSFAAIGARLSVMDCSIGAELGAVFVA
jgi:hypothetical protein